MADLFLFRRTQQGSRRRFSSQHPNLSRKRLPFSWSFGGLLVLGTLFLCQCKSTESNTQNNLTKASAPRTATSKAKMDSSRPQAKTTLAAPRPTPPTPNKERTPPPSKASQKAATSSVLSQEKQGASPHPPRQGTKKPPQTKVTNDAKKTAAAPKTHPFRKYLRRPPRGWVSLKELIPDIRLSIRYHTPDNFTNAPLPGYGAPGAWMLRVPALALKKVQADLVNKGMGLLVYDAYRPYRATAGMVAWGKRKRKMDLFRKGYIATRSGHNHGHTIDLTIVSLETGKPLDMGTPWDTLSPKSNTMNAQGQALKNRMILKKAMARRGFVNYRKEWWHFSFKMKRRTRPRDVPYGCYEVPEGRWKPPKKWWSPRFKMPMKWKPRRCKK